METKNLKKDKQIMTAKKMFEEEGYKLVLEDEDTLIYGMEYLTCGFYIEFDLLRGTVQPYMIDEGVKKASCLDMDDMRAVSKELEERGWWNR